MNVHPRSGSLRVAAPPSRGRHQQPGKAGSAVAHAPAGDVFEFRPWTLGRWVLWGVFALVLGVAPLIFDSGLGLTILSQVGIAIIACLSYNILLGQGGMLSFGHAVYTGLGAYIAVHALNMYGKAWLPVSLVPLVGGLGGLFFAMLLGWISTRRAHLTVAMITLGLGELVFSMSLMVPEFFGGEGGITTNRVVGKPVLGISFGPPQQLYYLIALYAFVCTVAMFAFTRTPLGRLLNAVRDNPQRVEFVGYNPHRIRYTGFMIAGFFAGIAGGLAVLTFEIVTAEVVGAGRSGGYLLFTFLGGTTFFFGPIIGAVLMVLAFVLFSEFTRAWLLYLGLVFIFMVMYAPGGIASLLMMNLRVAAFGRLRALWVAYLALAGCALTMLLGAAAMVEMVYHLQLDAGQGGAVTFLGARLDVAAADSWVGAIFVLITGAGLFELTRRHFLHQWGSTQELIEKEIKQREAFRA